MQYQNMNHAVPKYEPCSPSKNLRGARMDYSLAAPKLLCAQLKHANRTTSQRSMSLGGLLFQRVWLQGVLVSVSDDGRLTLDDGTGVVDIIVSGDYLQHQWRNGMYVMVIGPYLLRSGESPVVKVHKIVDLTEFPDREAMWYLEVMEAYEMFYRDLMEFQE